MPTDPIPQPEPPRAATPPGPYLCNVWDPIPSGWQRTQALKRTATCMTFDPLRHTVVQNVGSMNDANLADAVAQAGFARFRVPGTDAGFFARDRSATPDPTVRRTSNGLSR